MTKNETIKKFSISYDGIAMQSHSMNVSDLAPSLLALEKLIKTSYRLNGSNAKSKLTVIANQKGSFEIILNLIQTLTDTLELIKTNGPDDILKTLFGLSGLFILIKNIKGNDREIKKANENNKGIKINGVLYKPNIINMICNSDIKEKSQEILKPLQKEGIDIFKFSYDNKNHFSINKKEALDYLNSENKTNKTIRKFTKKYSIIKIHFEKGKWELSDGNSKISISIEDEQFIQKIENNTEVFSKGDFLKCEVREEQEEKEGKLKTAYFLEKFWFINLPINNKIFFKNSQIEI